MKVAITGSTGLVGHALVETLKRHQIQVVRLVRGETHSADDVSWDPASGKLDAAKLKGIDAVVNLAGDNIASGRWTLEKKQRIFNSRLQATKLLMETLAQLEQPPATVISASAIGYYGCRGDERLTESSANGDGFLAMVCREWEQAALHSPLAQAGSRVILSRFGIILSPQGGALAKMLPPFQMGAGGILGNGKQYMSWIALPDVASVLHHLLVTPGVAGAVNVVAPNPVRNSEFTRALGEVLGRPTLFPVPAFGAKLLFGQMADELLLASTNVSAEKLLASGYEFRFASIQPALQHLLRA
ncbi:MAG: TIGR01777 family oxidoreductase [Candidatus Melainabacteria bacterium]|nr:TIGR01777 family oxidoreductase [Candidatus Melainabacteria bacterium]